MLQTCTFGTSIRFAWKKLPAMLAIIFITSCSKEDHEPKPAECTYLSREMIQEGPSSAVHYKDMSTTQVNLNDDKWLLGATNVYKSELIDVTTDVIRRTTDRTEFTLSYDSDGFLTK
jgi:hypothetical protein